MAEWIDLIDPTPEELRAKLPREIHEPALDRAARVRRSTRTSLARTFKVTATTSSASSSSPSPCREEDRVFYQEVDVVVTSDVLVTVRKTPPGEPSVRPTTCP